MKTLYVTDLDGTLLNKQDRISEYSIHVINTLVEKGMIFTYATARSLSSASIVTKGLTTNIPVIVYNGAFIQNAATGEILSSSTFDVMETQFIVRLLTEHNIYPLVYAYINGLEKVSWITTKANAIQQLQTLLDCDRVVSFGDAVNDIPMFTISDECYAVEDAVPELKSIATGIIEANHQDGVAKWLYREYLD